MCLLGCGSRGLGDLVGKEWLWWLCWGCWCILVCDCLGECCVGGCYCGWGCCGSIC